MTHLQEFGKVEVTVRATIRPCQKEDLPALEWMGLYTRHRNVIRDAFEAQERGDGLMLLAIAAEFPIAQVWVRFGQHGRKSLAYLWAVRTFHPLQRAGIGRQMMQAAERILARHGIERAELEVDCDNQDVLGFYRGLGWHVVDRGDNDCFLLAKNIALHKPARITGAAKQQRQADARP
ncbi:GNAT family N-acetyltransferase [Phyllobacteriaceae bacterium JZ32]